MKEELKVMFIELCLAIVEFGLFILGACLILKGLEGLTNLAN